MRLPLGYNYILEKKDILSLQLKKQIHIKTFTPSVYLTANSNNFH